MTGLVNSVIGSGRARATVTADQARDALWALISAEMYDMLVNQRGWTHEQYQDWLIRAISAELL